MAYLGRPREESQADRGVDEGDGDWGVGEDRIEDSAGLGEEGGDGMSSGRGTGSWEGHCASRQLLT